MYVVYVLCTIQIQTDPNDPLKVYCTFQGSFRLPLHDYSKQKDRSTGRSRWPPEISPCLKGVFPFPLLPSVYLKVTVVVI